MIKIIIIQIIKLIIPGMTFEKKNLPSDWAYRLANGFNLFFSFLLFSIPFFFLVVLKEKLIVNGNNWNY
ncbi:MAG: hypothetical protein WAT92_15415 [Saprospiraceae bacterium]